MEIKKIKRRSKKGQVWIETVTYTLIAFVLIGLILAFVKPKIDELQDKALIDQSINVMKQIDSVVNEVYNEGVGNKRLVEVLIRDGTIIINSTDNSLEFNFEGSYMYSEPGQSYNEGSFAILTTQKGSVYDISIKKNYPNYDLTYSDKENSKALSKSSTPYELFISNKGGTSQNIDFSIK